MKTKTKIVSEIAALEAGLVAVRKGHSKSDRSREERIRLAKKRLSAIYE